jgi:hypothetical protein
MLEPKHSPKSEEKRQNPPPPDPQRPASPNAAPVDGSIAFSGQAAEEGKLWHSDVSNEGDKEGDAVSTDYSKK